RGYSFHLRNDPDVLRKLAEWIPLEQSCCPFLQFQVNIARRETPIILNVTGPRGTAEFIRQELGGRELGLAE
ncbi:MAG TPA: hypothetical protein VFE96_03935, partial [Candidatus Bathyarchaeia archaeon]|nr:hypothetical protein [Candidatus Bathyarchaeia archaeon]